MSKRVFYATLCGVLAVLVTAAARDIHFASDDGLDAPRGGGVVELLGREEIAVVGDSHGGHAAPRRLVHEFLNPAGAVQQAVIGVQMQMNESRSRHVGSL